MTSRSKYREILSAILNDITFKVSRDLVGHFKWHHVQSIARVGHFKWHHRVYFTENINVFYFVVNIVPADDLAPVGARTSSCPVMTMQVLGPVLIPDKMSYSKISWSIEAARLVVWIIASLWNLTGTSVALLPRCLSNFGAIVQC